MIKPIVVFLSILFTSAVFAGNTRVSSCIENLTSNYRFDSQAYSLDVSDVRYEVYGKDHMAFSVKVIRDVLAIEGCSKKAINFGKTPSGRAHNKCAKVSPRRNNSLSCYIETNLGYFFVTRDFQFTAHIVFNRWD